MKKHSHTESTNINFEKLKERILAVNDKSLNNVYYFKNMLLQIAEDRGSTLIMATGGSLVVAKYLKLILESINIISEVIEPRDFSYKQNIKDFSNLIVISASGNTNGISYANSVFTGNKYLISEKNIDGKFQTISWGNELYNREKSFISLATTLCPMTLLLEAREFLNKKVTPDNISDTNKKITDLLSQSQRLIEEMSLDFQNTDLIQIMTGYDTQVSSEALESNIIEAGLCSAITHDKGSFCHGRSNLLFKYPASKIIYLAHQKSDLDNLLIKLISENYSEPIELNTLDLNESIAWKEYYLLLQIYYLSKKISSDKSQELTQPDYNPKVIKKLYNFRGKM